MSVKQIFIIIAIALISMTTCSKNKPPVISIDSDSVRKIIIVYKPVQVLRNEDLTIIINNKDKQKLIIEDLEKSLKSLLYAGIGKKLSMIAEGGYEIIIELNNGDDVTYELPFENIITDRKKDISYSNDVILNRLRSLLFGRLIDEKIRLEK